jgi:hypothetical protein
MKYINDIYTNKAFHWLQFLRYNNLGFLNTCSLNAPPHKVKEDNTPEAIEAYHDINEQIIREFGIEESFLALKDKEQDIAILKLDFIIKGNKQKRTQWRIKELELQSPEEHNNIQLDISKEVSDISKNLRIGIIDIKEYSIFQYLTAKKTVTHGE